jgi:hypothetical protein
MKGYIDDVELYDEFSPSSFFQLIHVNYTKLARGSKEETYSKIDKKIRDHIEITMDERREVLSSLKFR